MSAESDSAASRRGGILLPVSALPGSAAVGDFGPGVDRWLAWLADAGQRLWQVLPIGPTTAYGGHSPYSALSVFAIDPIYVSLEGLVAERWLESAPPLGDPAASPGSAAASSADHSAARDRKQRPFRDAFEAWRAGDGSTSEDYAAFLQANGRWLPDYALFVALRTRFERKPWFEWPRDLRDRDPTAIETARREQAERVEFELFLQFVADRQWRSIRERAGALGISLFGDLPLYVSWDSADAWVERALLRLDDSGRPDVVSGVPPDYFSETGQRWGTPLYRWPEMREEGYRWWIARLERNAGLFDLVRLDHFRGLHSYWEIPVAETDAVRGRWVDGPGGEFFRAVRAALPDLNLVAEDLGVITDEVRALRAEAGLPGMRVLQFAFGEDFPNGEHLPHNLTRDAFLYTGTHDNNTTPGWFEEELDAEGRKNLSRYVGRRIRARTAHLDLIRLAYGSVAETVIVPLQDVLGLGSETRLNSPGVADGNWAWRVRDDQLSAEHATRLRETAETYGRTRVEKSSAVEETEGGEKPD